MILGLRIENGVKYKDRTFTFDKGLTTISGPNGAGKSLIQEFIRFGLFGSAALRGRISDYDPSLKITLGIKIRDEIITIKRTLKDCTIYASEGEEVRGTSTCNNWIVKKLGYDMSVFDIGNAAKQFEINKIGDMKPTERKNTIDQVIGLTGVTKLIKQLKEERNELKNYVSGFESALVEPIEPICPDNYVDSSELQKIYLEKVVIKDNANFLKRKCEELKCDPVTEWKGEIPQGDLSNESLYNHYKKEIEALPENSHEGSRYDRNQLTKLLYDSKRWSNWKEPEIGLEKIVEQKSQWEEYRAWKSAQRVKCPECGKEFTVNNIKEVEEPTLSEEYLKQQESLWLTRPSGQKPSFLIDESYFNSEIKKIENKEKLIQYTMKKTALECDYDLLRKFKEHQEKYNKYKEYENCLIKLKSLGDIEKISEECSLLWDRITEYKLYENKLLEYKDNKRKYDSLVNSVESKKIRMNQLNDAIDGLTELMSTVKNSIIPSLSVVATNLCREMSNDELQEIKINDEFEILVDGKELSLLSGSEKAVANLSIRLALSSILTRKIFNVFMGDEIDESMSEDRAEATAECLKRLSSQIEQIILISHRNIVGDHNIEI